MARFCGGFKIDKTTLKMVKGILTTADNDNVNPSKAFNVTPCSQLFDGGLFQLVGKCVTLHESEGGDIGDPVPVSPCGVKLDGRFFKVSGKTVSLQDGFLLTVVTDPEAASVKVVDADSVEVEPTEAGGKTYLLADIGDQYGVNVEYTGYTGKHLTITNDKDQTLNITLEETPQT